MSKISFVMPTKDRLEWIGESIQSLLDQSEKDIEIIVVNDASIDGTKDFLDEWPKDPRVKIIHNEKSLGAGKSRNIGCEAATSPIICVCDDDDNSPADRAEMTLRWFEENPESELVNFPYMRIDYFGENMEPFFGQPFDEEAFKKDGSVSYFSNPSCAYKKASAIEMGGYPSETNEKTDDIQFVTNWINFGKKIDFDPRVITNLHRVLPNSIMSKKRGFKPEWASK